MTDKWVAARAAHSHSDRHELVTRWLTRWSTLLFPAWVLLLSSYVLIEESRRGPVAASSTLQGTGA